MTTYIALLRGINVGGNILKMERLREIWKDLGFKNVRTYVQSGNVVFESGGSTSKLIPLIQQKLVGATRLPVSVLLRTAAEIEAIIERNPFLQDKGIDRSKLHVTFLDGAVTKETLKKLGAINAGPDEFRISGQDVYLHCPGRYGNTKLSNNAIQKALGVTATTRNWNTVNKLFEMASADKTPE